MEISAKAVHDSRPEYHRLASAFDEAKGALNVHNLIAATATSATSVGTGDRCGNETKYLQDAPFLLN